MLAGIASGLAAGFFQSLSYLATRQYVHTRTTEGRAGASRQLLVLSHVLMGFLSLGTLPFVWPASGVDFAAIAFPLAGVTLFYLIGQFSLMTALKHAEPSRISPILGLKVVVLACMVTLLPRAATTGPLIPLQWIAVALSVLAAYALNASGKPLPRKALLAVLLACISYSISDWNITLLVVALQKQSDTAQLHASVVGVALTYILCGLISLALLPHMGSRRLRDWRDALPFTCSWFIAMIFLYTSFALVAVVYGNILQSTRGLFSILMASLLIHLGYHHVEPHASRAIMFRRLAAALLMFAAVSLYAYGSLKMDPPPTPSPQKSGPPISRQAAYLHLESPR